ncbi:MAG: hypothetical protein HQL54_12250 [Magnetococcales bacterium]|nr:hypothetical protein [Magnetococcales bacterium]
MKIKVKLKKLFKEIKGDGKKKMKIKQKKHSSTMNLYSKTPRQIQSEMEQRYQKENV